jgi:hypothetical protein
MLRFARLAILALLLPLLAAPALALPAPMSEQELNDKSDLVAVVRVLSVTCTAVTQDEKTGEALPAYLAKLKLIEVKKGGAKAGDEVLVTWRAIPGEHRPAEHARRDLHPSTRAGCPNSVVI